MASKWIKLFFVVFGVLEIVVFLLVGFTIGFWLAILLVVLSVIIGVGLIRTKGFSAMRGLKPGQMPGMSLLQNMHHIIIGVFFIIPGFITTLFGLLLFIPIVRKKATALFFKRLLKSQFLGFSNMNFSAGAQNSHCEQNKPINDEEHGRTIDGSVNDTQAPSGARKKDKKGKTDKTDK